jgi:hypothetical protein
MRISNIPSAARGLYRNVIFYLRHGFKRSDPWSLDMAASRWIAPRLRYFRDHHVSKPFEMPDEEWTAKISTMLRAFELIAADAIQTAEEQSEITAGLELLPDYFQHLWD